MKYFNFHFAIQFFKFVWRGFTTKTKELTLTEKLQIAMSTGKTCEITFRKAGTDEVTTRKATNLKKSSKGTILFEDLEKQALRSFVPSNLLSINF